MINKIVKIREVVLVRINNVGEYKLIKDILKKRGITIEFTTIYTLY